MQKGHRTEAMHAIAITTVATCYAAAVGGIKRYRDPSVSLSVCPSLGYRHAGCLQLAGHQRCADCGPVRGRT